MKKFFYFIFIICIIPFIVIIDLALPSQNGIGNILFFVGTILFFIISIFIHELGHLFFGYLSGYNFLSYRFFSHIIYKDEDGKIRKGKSKAPGIAGQCLMSYDKEYSSDMPFYWYNAGGGIFNFLSALIVSIPMNLFIDNVIVFSICFSFVFIAIILGAANTLYFTELGDGANMHYLLKKDADSCKSLYDQLLFCEKMSHNIEFKDIKFLDYEFNSYSALSVTSYILKMYEHCSKNQINEAIAVADYLEKGILSFPKQLRLSITLEVIIFKATKTKEIENIKELVDRLPKSQKKIMTKMKEISILLGYIVYLIYGLKEYDKASNYILEEEKLIESYYQRPLANYYKDILEEIKKDIPQLDEQN